MFLVCVFSPVFFPVIELSALCLVVLTSPSPCCRGRLSHSETTWCNCRETNPGWSTHWTHCDIDPLKWLVQTPCNFRRQRLLRRQLVSGLQRRTFLYNRTRCCPTNPPYPRHLAASALLVTEMASARQRQRHPWATLSYITRSGYAIRSLGSTRYLSVPFEPHVLA